MGFHGHDFGRAYLFANRSRVRFVYSTVPMRRRRLARVLIGLVILYSVAAIVCGIILAEITLHLPRHPLRHRSQAEAVARQQFHTELQDVSVRAEDGIELKGWFLEAPHGNGSVVILLHGVTDNREGVAGYAPMFLSAGYSVLLPDSRAHGESGGDLATYGLRERYDVLQWTKWIQQDQARGCVYLFGESMGAAISLQAAAVTPGLCAVAVESPFSTFREIAYDRMAQHTMFGPWFWRSLGRPVIEIALAYSRMRYKVDLTKASPEDALEHTSVPALLIAGTADRNIPMRHSAELVRTSGSHAEMWVVNGADHGGAVGVAHDEFERRILTWFHDHQQPR